MSVSESTTAPPIPTDVHGNQRIIIRQGYDPRQVAAADPQTVIDTLGQMGEALHAEAAERGVVVVDQTIFFTWEAVVWNPNPEPVDTAEAS